MDKESGTFIYTYTMKYCLAIKRNEILPFVATQMALQGIILGEISLTEKDKYYMILLNVESQNKQKTNPSIDTDNSLMVARGRG